MEQIVLMICFLFFFILNPKFKRVTHFSHSTIKKPFSEVSLQTRESLKKPYFPLPLSILTCTNLIMLLIFLFNPRLLPKKFHPLPIRFPGKFILVWFPRKSLQNLQGKQKKLLFFFHPCVLWIYFRGLFAFVPLDLNFTKPKSMIFEPDWKILPANRDQITKYHLIVFFFLNVWTDFASCMAWPGRKYREISQKYGKKYR